MSMMYRRLLVAITGLTLALPAMAGDPNAEANAYFAKAYEEFVASEPTMAASLGLRIRYGEWSDPSEAGNDERLARAERQLAGLRETVDREKLDRSTRLSYDVFVESLQRRIARHQWRNHNYRFDKNGPQSSLPAFLINTHRVESVADAEAYIERLQGIAPYITESLARAEQSRQDGVLPPKFVFAYVIEDARNVTRGRPFDEGPADSPLFADVHAKFGKLDLTAEQREVLEARAELALLESVKPAFDAIVAWAEKAQLTATTDDGIWKLPDGEAYYNYLLSNFTTTNMTADEIHELGLREVARLHGQMREVMTRVGFKGDLQAFFQFMRTDPQFYYPDTPEGKSAYLAEATRVIDAMRERLPDLFVTLPKAQIEVRAVEAFREKSAGKAFYQGPTIDGARPGVYYANLYQMAEMPKYEMEALAYHEGIPGHHMQIAIAREQEALPQFRRFGGYTAYSEGWGLYSERLPKELGFYSDPYSEFGRLSMELLRAIRLVVDTGLHAKRWTRDQTIRYHVENSSMHEDAAAKATERYILSPGQATAYMVGMLKILELRQRANDALGEKFDVREFHDLVLRTGGVPLTVLESELMEWVAQQQAADPS